MALQCWGPPHTPARSPVKALTVAKRSGGIVARCTSNSSTVSGVARDRSRWAPREAAFSSCRTRKCACVRSCCPQVDLDGRRCLRAIPWRRGPTRCSSSTAGAVPTPPNSGSGGSQKVAPQPVTHRHPNSRRRLRWVLRIVTIVVCLALLFLPGGALSASEAGSSAAAVRGSFSWSGFLLGFLPMNILMILFLRLPTLRRTRSYIKRRILEAGAKFRSQWKGALFIPVVAAIVGWYVGGRSVAFGSPSLSGGAVLAQVHELASS
eukprot:scaffold1233_cov395-Prasinococcus_capsulatus_cf.AAC.41